MAIRIPFDAANNPESPTVVLAKRNGEKIGQIDAHNISVSDSFNDAAELSFQVYKELNGEKSALWDEVTNFKLVYCLEWNQWFEIAVELDESNETVKTVFGTELGYAELGQINLYNIEINTEEDIARDDYKDPTVLFDETNPKASLLHRIMEKAPHYTVTHVDASIAKIQRSFSFDDESIMDAFQDIAEEIKCIFIPKAETDGKTGELKRTIEVYDLQNYCPDCGHRWDSVEQDEMCPECGKKNVKPGYGDDTTIFITSDELADDIDFETDTDAVKNCFKLEGGDDLMTATIRNCNPNGTDYLWYFSDDMKREMPQTLVDKIEDYDELYEYYQKEHVVMQTANTVLNQYNQLVDKYTVFNEDLEKINVPIVGYPALMNAYYNTIDFNLYLTSSMMPSVETMETDAHKELTKLNTAALSPVAVQSVNVISNATADNAVLSMARLIVDTRFKVTVNSSTLVKGSSICTWTGSFTVINYYDEEDTATGGNVVVTINENYVEFVRQKIEKQLSRDNNVDEIDVVSLFEKDYADFVNELRKYSLNRLKSFQAACQAVLDILVEQGIADKDTWSSGDPNLYDDLYYPYYRKLGAIESEISLREQEISVIVGVKDADGDVTKYGLQNYLDDYRDEIHDALDFEKYMGEQLWLDFCAYRREDKYSNDNFISDALDNKELFDRAQEFIEIATQEIHKSAEQQHSISSDLKNLLVINKFKPLVDSFGVGNWLRVMVDDTVYKLRLIQYSIDYDDIENISVEFSDVIKSKDSASDIQSVLEQASSMATSYDSIKRQAADGKNASNMVDGWVADGLDLTNMMIVGNAENQNIEWGERGLLAREYLPITDTYDDRQLKLINRGLYVTSDGWETARAGIGNFMFWNPKTKETEEAYGVIADTIVGNIILSEEVGIYNKSNSITMDGDGFTLTTNADGTDPENIFTIQKEVKDQQGNPSINKLLYVDSNGNLTLNGAINVVNSFSEVHTINDLGDPDRILVETNTEIASIKADLSSLTSEYTQTKQTVSDLGIETQNLNSKIEQTASSIRAEVSSSISDVNGNISDLSTKVDLTAGQLRVEITSAVDAAGNAIDIANGSIKTVDVEYGISNSPTVAPTSWSTNSPQWQAGKYIWQRTKTTTPEGVSSYSKAVCIQGAKGQDGIDGTNGKDGINGSSSYFHVAYANSADGSKDFSTTVSANKQYIGTYVDNIQNDSNDHTKYSWTLIKGADGKDGIAGTNGKDGTTYYLHIAYANDANGKDFSTTDGANKKYIGQCVNTTQADPNTYTSYTWSLFKGADGTDGLPGKNGKDGTSSYVHIKYSATMPDSDNDMTETPSEYIGICTDNNEKDPTDPGPYTWSKFEGKDGKNGIQGPAGKDGVSTYVHFAYSTTADGSGNFNVEPFDGALYIGVLTNSTKEDSQIHTDYTWSLMKGSDGKNGDYITDIFEQYYLSTSATKQEGGSWSTTQPAWSSGHYIWTRSEVHWIKYSSEGDPIAVTEYTEPVLAQAINGANENASYVRGFMEYDGTGLTIGRYNTGTNDTVSKVKLASTGRLEVYNGNTEVAYFGSTARIGTTSGYNTYIDSSSVKIRYGTTVLSEFGSSYARIGKSNGFNTYIDSNSVDIKSGNTVLSTFTGDSITLGASSKSRMILGSSGLDFYQQYNNGSLHALSISASGGDVPSLTINNVCGGYFYLMSGQTNVRISGREFRVYESTGGEMFYLYGYNEQIKIFGNTLADWVTSQGDNGTWNYRYWKSGRKEAWRTLTIKSSSGSSGSGGQAWTQTLPTSFGTYTVNLSLKGTSSEISNFNDIYMLAWNRTSNGFTVSIWKDAAIPSGSGYAIDIYVCSL